MRFNSHPVATLGDGHCSYFSPHVQHQRYTLDTVAIYHFGFARSNMNDIMLRKKAYYEQELAKHGGANKEFDEKVDVFLGNTESPMNYYKFDRNLIPEHMRALPMWNYKDAGMDSIADTMSHWTSDAYYGPWVLGESVPNIYLTMTNQANPAMHRFDNRIFI